MVMKMNEADEFDYDYDNYFKVDEYVRTYEDRYCYDMDEHEKKSIEEIKRCIINGTYCDKEMVMAHMAYLERLADKIQQIIVNEKKEGVVAWDLEDDYKKIRKLHDRLNELYHGFDEGL